MIMRIEMTKKEFETISDIVDDTIKFPESEVLSFNESGDLEIVYTNNLAIYNFSEKFFEAAAEKESVKTLIRAINEIINDMSENEAAVEEMEELREKFNMKKE